MLHRNFGWRGGRGHRLYALAAVRRQKSQTVIVQRSRPTLMPDDARQPRQIRLETIHSLRVRDPYQSSADVSLGNCLILNNNWLTKYDSVRLAEQRNDHSTALDWTVRCVALFPEFPHPATGSGPQHLVRLTAALGLPALEASWQRCTGTA